MSFSADASVHPVYGPCAVSLGAAVPASPGLSEDLDDWRQALRLDRFYRFGGEDAPVTPTEAYLCWDAAALYVAFRCAEPNPRYRPLCREGEENPAFADSVGVWVRPRWDAGGVYFLMLASSGDARGLRYGGQQPEHVEGFTAEVQRTDAGWVARFTIPWTLIGGRPEAPFGVNVQRTRGQSSERLSPVPLDYTGEPAPDLLLEAAFGGTQEVITRSGTLASLPSGHRRWQLPALLRWPSRQERWAIWMLQEQLAEPTSPGTLADRLALVQRWLDLLILEGFSFHTEGGSWYVREGEYRPEQARRAINDALAAGDEAGACRILDTFLHQLDAASRRWFADGTPGNVGDQWVPLTDIEAIDTSSGTVRLQCRVNGCRMNLYLCAPAPGCLRISGEQTGFFDFPTGLPLDVAILPDGIRASIEDLEVEITRDPWTITVRNRDGDVCWQLQSHDLAFLFDDDSNILAIDLGWNLERDEVIYGFGERFDRLNQRGNVVTLWDLDAWEGTIYGLRNQAYKPIPLLHSTRGASVFFNTTYRIRADIGQEIPNRARFTVRGAILDLYLWSVPPLSVLQSYTTLTGRPVLPPRWAFEPWMGGGWGRWKHGPLGDPAAEMLHVVDRFAELDIPHAGIYAEGEGSDDPRLFAGLEPRHIRPFTWMNSTIGLKGQRELLPDVPDDELPILHHEDGRPFPYIDFTHPRAMELLRNFWTRRLDLGIAGSMVDFGDLVPEDAVFADGRQGDYMHNFYAYDYHRSFREVFTERRGEDFVLFSRSAAPGSQRWLCQFAGDHQPNFTGLAAALYGGLNLSACGFSIWGCDIGGYLGWPDPETYIRWVEWGCFSPIMRCHGTQPREPWEYGEEAVRIYAFYARLRENLLDYLFSAAVEAHRTGRPLMQALPLAFPADPIVSAVDDAYLFGPDLLAAPMHAAGDAREVAFPGGQWVNFWTGEAITGPIIRTVDAPLDRIPLFLREGALMPVRLNHHLRWGESMTGDSVAALVVTLPVSQVMARCWETPVSGAVFASAPSGSGFILHIDDAPDMRYVLIYGCPVAEVFQNGSLLPQLTGDAVHSRPPGWFVDGGRTIVRLAHGVRQHVKIVIA